MNNHEISLIEKSCSLQFQFPQTSMKRGGGCCYCYSTMVRDNEVNLLRRIILNVNKEVELRSIKLLDINSDASNFIFFEWIIDFLLQPVASNYWMLPKENSMRNEFFFWVWGHCHRNKFITTILTHKCSTREIIIPRKNYESYRLKAHIYFFFNIKNSWVSERS